MAEKGAVIDAVEGSDGRWRVPERKTPAQRWDEIEALRSRRREEKDRRLREYRDRGRSYSSIVNTPEGQQEVGAVRKTLARVVNDAWERKPSGFPAHSPQEIRLSAAFTREKEERVEQLLGGSWDDWCGV